MLLTVFGFLGRGSFSILGGGASFLAKNFLIVKITVFAPTTNMKDKTKKPTVLINPKNREREKVILSPHGYFNNKNIPIAETIC